MFAKMSHNETRRFLSGVIDNLGKQLEIIASKRSLEFRYEKHNKEYVEFGSSSRMLTFKLWYISEILKRRIFIKIQINFVENILFPVEHGILGSLLSNVKIKDLNRLFPNEYNEYSKRIAFYVYDLREIFCEKVRAILTRKGIKARDFVDVYMISTVKGIRLESLTSDILVKTSFILKLYTRYRSNFTEKKDIIKMGNIFEWGNERTMLISRINDVEFYTFLEKFNEYLRKVSSDIQ